MEERLGHGYLPVNQSTAAHTSEVYKTEGLPLLLCLSTLYQRKGLCSSNH